MVVFAVAVLEVQGSRLRVKSIFGVSRVAARGARGSKNCLAVPVSGVVVGIALWLCPLCYLVAGWGFPPVFLLILFVLLIFGASLWCVALLGRCGVSPLFLILISFLYFLIF